MTWIIGKKSQTYLAKVDSIRARVWRAPARTRSARVLTPRKDFWHHDFPTADAAKAWCEAQMDTVMDAA